MGVEILTIGHSNLQVDEFVAELRKHGVELLVDVRSAPYSQFLPHFNRENLERTLDDGGIGYAFAGEHLGGRPRDPACYRNGQVPVGKADYLALVDYDAVAERPWYRQAIGRLLELADQQRTSIMCSEEDPLRCHRHHLIAQTLLDQGVTVWHVRTKSEVGERLVAATRKPVEQPQPRQLTLMS